MKLQKSFGTLLLGGALAISSQLLAVKPANAALLAQYNFDPTGTLNNSAPASSGVAVSTFQNGPGIITAQSTGQTATGTGRSRAVTFGNLSSSTKDANAATGAIQRQTYFTFTLNPSQTPGNRFGIKFDNLTFTTDVGIAGPTVFGNFFVQANVGAGGAFVDVVTNGNNVGGTVYTQQARPAGSTPTFVPRNIDLSGFSDNGGYFTRPIEFRIYEYDNAGGNAGGLRLDDIQLNGTLAPVPELSTGLLVALSLGGLCIVGMRRKKGASPSMNMAF